MEEQHDLRDRTGRAVRVGIGIAIGIAVGVAVYFIADAAIPREPAAMLVSRRQMGRDTFIAWASMLSGVVTLFVALIVQNRLARNRWERERIPRAQVR